MAGAADSYRAWLARRIEEGNDLERVRLQLGLWKRTPPHDTNAALFDELLAELDAAGPKPKKAKAAPPADVGAFD